MRAVVARSSRSSGARGSASSAAAKASYASSQERSAYAARARSRSGWSLLISASSCSRLLLIVELCEVELGDPLRVGEEVELDDLPVLDRHGADGEGLAVAERDGSGGAVDERAPNGEVDAGPQERLAGDCLRPLNDVRCAGEAAVGPEHDVGVEHGDERVEVTLPRGRLERLDDFPLGG